MSWWTSGCTFSVSWRFSSPVPVGHRRAEQPIGLHADLVGRAVIDSQRAGPTANVHPQRLPRERLLENSLSKVAGEEQGDVYSRLSPFIQGFCYKSVQIIRP
jgi:hypothetical protein